MNPTPTQIVESTAWAEMLEAITRGYFERFVATDPSQCEDLCRLRANLEALHEIDRELNAMARGPNV